MNRLKKLLSILLAFTALLSLTTTALADETEADLYNNEKIQTLVINISYEHDDLKFAIISPSGEEITKDTSSDKIAVSYTKTLTTIVINDAEAGQWKIRYDKGSNETFNVSVGNPKSDFWITDFSTGEMAEGEIPVNFTLSSSEDIPFNYTVYLTVSTDTLDGRELYSDTASSGEPVEIMVPISDVSTYSEYYLMIYAETEINGSKLFDVAYSEKFSYTNPDSPDAISGVDATIHHDSSVIELDWDDYVPYDCDSLFIEYYLDDKLISSDEYLCDDTNSTTFSYDSEEQDAKFVIYLKSDELLSESFELTVDIDSQNNLKLKFPESGLVYSNIWSYEYENADSTDVTFIINDEDYIYTLDGKGSKFLNLSENRNTIEIIFKDNNGIRHYYKRVANISSITPTIEFINPLDGVITQNEYIIISGKTNAQELFIGDEVIKIDDGIFTYKYDLEDGSNSITLKAGIGDNYTTIKANVTKESTGILGSSSFPVWIIPLGTGLLLSVIGILMMTRLHKKKLNPSSMKEKAPKPAKIKNKKPHKPGYVIFILSIISYILTIGLWIWFIIRKIFENSVDYITLAYNSLSDADSYLTNTVIILIIAIVMTVVAIGLTILWIVIRKIKNKKS